MTPRFDITGMMRLWGSGWGTQYLGWEVDRKPLCGAVAHLVKPLGFRVLSPASLRAPWEEPETDCAAWDSPHLRKGSTVGQSRSDPLSVAVRSSVNPCSSWRPHCQPRPWKKSVPADPCRSGWPLPATARSLCGLLPVSGTAEAPSRGPSGPAGAA